MEREIKGLETLQKYFQNKEEVMAVYVFGSVGTKYETAISDLDIAILFSRKFSLLEEMQVEAELNLIFPEKEIDLTNLNNSSVIIQHKVLLTGELIYERDSYYTAEFKERTLKLYFDYGLTYKKFQEDLTAGLREKYGPEAGE